MNHHRSGATASRLLLACVALAGALCGAAGPAGAQQTFPPTTADADDHDDRPRVQPFAAPVHLGRPGHRRHVRSVNDPRTEVMLPGLVATGLDPVVRFADTANSPATFPAPMPRAGASTGARSRRSA